MYILSFIEVVEAKEAFLLSIFLCMCDSVSVILFNAFFSVIYNYSSIIFCCLGDIKIFVIINQLYCEVIVIAQQFMQLVCIYSKILNNLYFRMVFACKNVLVYVLQVQKLHYKFYFSFKVCCVISCMSSNDHKFEFDHLICAIKLLLFF